MLQGGQLLLYLIKEYFMAKHLLKRHLFDCTGNASFDIESLMHLAVAACAKSSNPFVESREILNLLDPSEVTKI